MNAFDFFLMMAQKKVRNNYQIKIFFKYQAFSEGTQIMGMTSACKVID